MLSTSISSEELISAVSCQGLSTDATELSWLNNGKASPTMKKQKITLVICSQCQMHFHKNEFYIRKLIPATASTSHRNLAHIHTSSENWQINLKACQTFIPNCQMRFTLFRAHQSQAWQPNQHIVMVALSANHYSTRAEIFDKSL